MCFSQVGCWIGQALTRWSSSSVDSHSCVVLSSWLLCQYCVTAVGSALSHFKTITKPEVTDTTSLKAYFSRNKKKVTASQKNLAQETHTVWLCLCLSICLCQSFKQFSSWPSLCLSICLCLFICLFLYSTCLIVHLYLLGSVYPAVSLSVCPSISRSRRVCNNEVKAIWMCVCVHHHH